MPRSFRISPDGVYLRTKGGGDPVTCLWTLDVETGAERLAADPRTLGMVGTCHRRNGPAGSGSGAAAS